MPPGSMRNRRCAPVPLVRSFAVCFPFDALLCPPPPKPPGVRHFTMELFFQSISFSLHVSYPFLTGGSYLKDRKITCWVAWRHPAFFISGIPPPTVNNSPIKGELFRVTEPQNCYAGYPCFLNTFLRVLQKTLCWFPALLQPKSTILSHFQAFFRETTRYKPMQAESCHHFQVDRRIYP